MDGRYNPYDSPSQQRQRAHALQAALEMEEALFLQQRQHEMQRDLQIRQDLQLRQMLLQDQIDHQLMQGPGMLQQQRLYELQNYTQNPLAALEEERLLQQQLQQQEQLRRQQLQQELHLLANQHSPRRDYAASDAAIGDSLDGAPQIPLRKSESLRGKRSVSQDDMAGAKAPSHRKQPRKETSVSINADDDYPEEKEPMLPPPKKKTRRSKKSSQIKNGDEESSERNSAGRDVEPAGIEEGRSDTFCRGTVEELVAAAEAEREVQDAATAVVALQNVEWSDSEPEDDTPAELIELPGFISKLPRLPKEPEYFSLSNTKKSRTGGGAGSKMTGKSEKESDSKKKPAPAKDAGSKNRSGIGLAEYPYQVDTWWPANTTVRRERRIRGEQSDEEDNADEPLLSNEDSLLRGNLSAIRRRLVNEVEPGVLEKLPHCKIHQMRANKVQKGVKAEPVFCWQVTENTCNDIMLCCSVCSSWRHAACGGHFEPFSIRRILESNVPFTPICDRCHEEMKFMEGYPKSQARIDRQRIEHLRRGLSTSAVMRATAYAKHGGTYKWPLGSVSATHIGGHTRSVHSRHDKAEKQWAEMTVRLGRGLGYRPKERVKVRTRELERLLVSVEDAEGIMDRHNMMQFLLRDTGKDHPVGFSHSRRNLFDPEDDFVHEAEVDANAESENAVRESTQGNRIDTDTDEAPDQLTDQENQGSRNKEKEILESHSEENSRASFTPKKPALRTCAREGCRSKPRFDSAFCSDSCGVSALELDLFRSFQYASDIHPTLLRS